MTGPEHYRQAELLLETGEYDSDEMDLAAYDVGRAQVHATLALAAATALRDAKTGFPTADWAAWVDTASAWKRPKGDAA